MAKPTTTDAYLARLPADQRVALEKVRKAIRSAAPKAQECFSYGLPAFRDDGGLLAGFGASAQQCAYYPMRGTVVRRLQSEREQRPRRLPVGRARVSGLCAARSGTKPAVPPSIWARSRTRWPSRWCSSRAATDCEPFGVGA